MNVETSIEKTRKQIKEWKKTGNSVGLVPTMGFLHEGHLSLIRKAEKENDKVIVSIFVNPMQFGQGDDLDTYPRDFEQDSRICQNEGVDMIFHPEPIEMYPENFRSYVDMDFMTEQLSGKKREGHFRGVCTVVNKLFNISDADRAYFGQKDAQQLVIIQRMVKDLNIDIQIVPCPTVREEDGLAMSSRNTNLSKEERDEAPNIYGALEYGKLLFQEGTTNPDEIKKAINHRIFQNPLLNPELIEIVNPEDMNPVDFVGTGDIILVSVRVGKVLLLDNIIL